MKNPTMRKLSAASLSAIVLVVFAAFLLTGFVSRDETLTPVKPEKIILTDNGAADGPATSNTGLENTESNSQGESDVPAPSEMLKPSSESMSPGPSSESPADPKSSAPAPEKDTGSIGAMPSCPMSIAGTKVSEEDTASGAALAFTTTGNVADLQQKVQQMMNHHNMVLMGEIPAAPSDEKEKLHHANSKSSTASYEALSNGARLIFTPKDPAQLSDLRAELKEHASWMSKKGACPMDRKHGSSGGSAPGSM